MTIKQDYSLAVFEVVPIERLGGGTADELVRALVEAMQQAGYGAVEGRRPTNGVVLEVKDAGPVRSLIARAFHKNEEELAWLAGDFFEHFMLFWTKRDILFALASKKDCKADGGPYSRPPHYAVSEIGSQTHAPCTAKIMCVAALGLAGKTDLAQSLEVKWLGFPPETSLTGSVELFDWPVTCNLTIQDMETETKWSTVHLLSSRMLLTQSIVQLLADESLLSAVELAKVTPFYSCSSVGRRDNFNRDNYLWVRARFGCLVEVFEEMLGACIHLNWQYGKGREQLPAEAAAALALAQHQRMTDLERKEQDLQSSLSVLQRRYPTRPELLEWAVNNLYTNIARYSPIHLAWKGALNDILQGRQGSGSWIHGMIGRLDWGTLEHCGVATMEDARRLPEILHADPPSMLVKMRALVENMITYLYRQHTKKPKGVLATMIKDLKDIRLFPPLIFACVDFLRQAGNIGAHESAGAKEDVEAVLPVFLRFTEWFVTDGLKWAAVAP